MDRSNWNDDQLLEAIRTGAGESYEAALQHVFITWSSGAETFLKKNSATAADIEPAFAPGLVYFVCRVNSPNFQLSGSLEKTFQLAIADAWMLAGLHKGPGNRHRDAAFIYADQHWRDVATRAILHLGGTMSEAEEAFALSFQQVLDRMLKPDFVLHSGSTDAYFRRAVENRWRDMQKRKPATGDMTHIPAGSEQNEEILADEIDRITLDENDQKILQKCMDRLDDRCRKILTLAFQGTNMERIAEIFDWKGGAQVARNQKGKCMKKLMDLLPPDLIEKFKPKKGRPRK